MLLSKQVQKAVVRAFNMRRFETGIHEVEDSEGKRISAFHVGSVWIAEVHDYYVSTVTVAVIHSPGYQGFKEKYEGLHKGLLLLPSYLDYQNPRSETLKTAEITWPDPVTEALKNLNVMCETHLQFGGEVPSYSLYIEVPHTWNEINHYGVTDDPSRVALWKGLLDMTEKLKQAYNDEKINEAVVIDEFDE